MAIAPLVPTQKLTFLTRTFPLESPRKMESECGAKFIDFEPEFKVVDEIGSKIDFE
jgi:hypothetical protein